MSQQDEQSDTQRVADDLADRIIGCETAEQTLRRIEDYLTTPLPIERETRVALSLAAITHYRRSRS